MVIDCEDKDFVGTTKHHHPLLCDGFDGNHNAATTTVDPQEAGRQIAKDLIKYKLTGQSEESPLRASHTMRRLSAEMEKEHQQFFSTVCNDLPIEEQSFREISRSTMDGEFNWGRLVSIFTLGGEVARIYKSKNDDRAEEVEDWLTECVAENEEQIARNGGWEGFEARFEPHSYIRYVALATGFLLAAVSASFILRRR